MSRISVKDAVKRYGNNTVIPDLNLEIGDGELFTLLGPSGCGKTTILRMIAGFQLQRAATSSSARSRINDMDPNKRDIGMVFQNYAICSPLQRATMWPWSEAPQGPKEEIHERVMRILDLVELTGMEGRMTNQLSGGQQQRVALARALVIEPGCAALGRAALQPGRQAACFHAYRDPPHPTGGRHHRHLCHPRSG